ncbi:hypothetical protein BJ986_002408 [Phycicoccus badiiscoriae]|uniref:DUF2029 domain-containing protein n=1 Tax=Pedococcus badiiscoriae TaxID=642776 RepID=A0A852WJY1_9MICO|nr:glycosyltransferase 87 family protein [Pedococcus badiiscoriae]NYG07921.1 hypothetical protein [Pedococcus badiiscoriae]
MRRLVVGTSVMVACSTTYALAGDLDQHRLRLAAVVVPWWFLAVVVTRWVGSAPATQRVPRPSTLPGGPRRVLVVVFLVALAAQLPGLLSPPRSSSDAYRYVWDGRVQLSGTSPYRFAPLDDRLAALRDPVLFPGLGPQDHSGYRTRPTPTDRADVLARAANDPRTRINRPRVPTIYPPVAQAWFAAVAWLTPWSWGTVGLQLGSALLAAGIAVALASMLRRSGRDPWGALWWAWCPAVVAESGNGAHVDVLAAAFVVAALATATAPGGRPPAGRVVAAGVLGGLAVATKLYPAVVLAALFPLRRNAVRALGATLAAAVTVVAAYLPHWVTAGPLVLGYLPGYLLEEQGPNRDGILALVLPGAALGPASVAVLGAVSAVVAWRLTGRAQEAAAGAALLFGTLLLVTTPSYPWYALPLVACAVRAGRLEWLAVVVAATVAYTSVSVHPLPTLAYCASALVVLAATVFRHLGERRRSGGR